MGDIIRFQTNVPVTVTPKYADGKEVSGRFGPQVMFSTVDDRLFFLDPPQAAKLHALRLAEGEPVTICKSSVKEGRRQVIRWEVFRAEAESEQKPVSLPPAPASAPAPQAVRNTEAQSATTLNILARSMASALIASIDAVRIAADYAKSKGLEASIAFDFNAEDIRAMANSALMGIQREQENALKYRNASNGNGYVNGHVNGNGNGGATWPRQ